jgi:hypothetical protein
MNHFGVAIGVIIVTVVGGAVVLDRATSEPKTHATIAQAAPSQVATPPQVPASDVADVKSTDTVIAAPAAHSKPMRTRSTKTVVASAPESQVSIQPLPPTNTAPVENVVPAPSPSVTSAPTQPPPAPVDTAPPPTNPAPASRPAE